MQNFENKITVTEKILNNKIFNSLLKKFEKEIENFDGRINVRKSGTESMIRIMVESFDEQETINVSNQLTKAAQQIA